MYSDILKRFIEPGADQFDAHYYDFDRPCKDQSQLPEFLQEMISYPVCGSGTNKYLWIIYQLASRARAAIECGVWEGGITVPLAMGLKRNNGHLISLDIDLTRPALRHKLERYGIDNITLAQMNDLDFSMEGGAGGFDLVYLDSLHTYEHVVRQLFHFDTYLAKGGMFILHDIVNTVGLELPNKEDYGYHNADDYINMLVSSGGTRHISEYPVLRPAPNCLYSPINLAIETFLAYRPSYKIRRIMDWAGMAFIWKL